METTIQQIHDEISVSTDSLERHSVGEDRHSNKPMAVTNNWFSREVAETRSIQIDLEAQNTPFSLQLIDDGMICRDPELTEVVSF